MKFTNSSRNDIKAQACHAACEIRNAMINVYSNNDRYHKS